MGPPTPPTPPLPWSSSATGGGATDIGGSPAYAGSGNGSCTPTTRVDASASVSLKPGSQGCENREDWKEAVMWRVIVQGVSRRAQDYLPNSRHHAWRQCRHP